MIPLQSLRTQLENSFYPRRRWDCHNLTTLDVQGKWSLQKGFVHVWAGASVRFAQIGDTHSGQAYLVC